MHYAEQLCYITKDSNALRIMGNHKELVRLSYCTNFTSIRMVSIYVSIYKLFMYILEPYLIFNEIHLFDLKFIAINLVLKCLE